ncbi:MAG: 23S rRNA (uracil(1939)-C(5))-methyltransferase RlmD [Lachnospiraceae bacterium]|nr:23S rRNA (uracil(1939)-C(5))-methyltransferase RlmD [Lachnospiraceae bacterium]MBO6208885.1 23S rRNA (uracil(1939)-C(5))-methyltransferase RlmD [Lachnospiraceae bacterium]
MYKKNEIIELQITDLGSEGEGIGKIDGFPFFVKGALPGDTIRASVMKAKKNMAFARMQEILTPSSDRIEAPCPVFGRCGGCQLMHLSYPAQLRYKEQKVKNALQRIGGVAEEELNAVMEPIIGMTPNPQSAVPLRYRNKTQVPFGKDRDGNTIYGFYAGRTHAVIPCMDCLLGVEENKDILENVRQWMEENHVQPYDETTGKGLLRHVLIRKGFHTGQIMTCLVINGKKLPKKEALCERLAQIPGMHSISISVNEENTNVIMGDNYETIWGEDRICDEICRLGAESITYGISPLSFYQVNPVQTEKLYTTALEYAGLTGNETVWDLYCGIGTISLFLAKSAKQVYGVEIVPQAIADAKENAKQNGITNAQFFVGAAEEVLPAYYRERRTDSSCHPDVIVVDPPRKGCDIACLETMVQMQPQRIVYVSCDPATLARDIKYLREQGYKLQRVRACDMFPNSFHVETAALLVR